MFLNYLWQQYMCGRSIQSVLLGDVVIYVCNIVLEHLSVSVVLAAERIRGTHKDL